MVLFVLYSWGRRFCVKSTLYHVLPIFIGRIDFKDPKYKTRFLSHFRPAEFGFKKKSILFI